MNPPSEPAYFLVRTIQELIEKDLVGVGWVDFEFDQIRNAEEIIRQINDAYGIGRYSNQIRRYVAMQEGDVVVAPMPYCIAIGIVTGGMIYDKDYYDADRANQRRVRFLRDLEGKLITIPRISFSEAFQRRLRVMGMVVNDLSEFSEDLKKAMSKAQNGEDYSYMHQLNDEIGRQQSLFKEKLRTNIQTGKTNLPTGGAGLEQLVRDLLECDGYQARILSKHHFGGYADADVLATRSDRYSVTRLLVQVKHHQGWSNEHGISQLEEIPKAHPGEYDEHQLVMVTSASVSDELRKRALNTSIIVVDGLELAGWISEHIDKLPKQMKSMLGIYEVPAVL